LKKQFLFYCVIVSLTILLVHCGGGGAGHVVSYPGAVTPDIQANFNNVERQYLAKNFSYAYDGYQHFIETYPHNKLTDEALYKQGKIFFLQARLDDAVNKFKELADKTPNPKYQAKAWHMIAYARYKNQNFDQAINDLAHVTSADLSTELRVQYFSLAVNSARLASTNQDFGDFAALQLYDTYESFAGAKLRTLQGSDVISFEKTKSLISAWIASPLLTSQITDWMKDYDLTAPARSFVDFKLGKTHFEEQKFTKAKKLLVRFVSKYPKNQYSAQAQKMLETLGADITDGTSLKKMNFSVGVLVPLTGRHETFGLSVIDGVKCAAGINNICHEASGINLIVKDSGYAPETLRLAIDEMIQNGAVAIIGPLSSDLAIEASLTASQKQVPIFPITQKENLMAQSDFIFQVGMQPKQQIQELVKAARSRGYRSFGVFYPNTNYGKTMADLFMEEAKQNECRITGLAEYNKWSKDTYAEARKLKSSIGRVSTPDRGVGFDAIFIPDSYQNVNAIVGALEFNGLSGVALLGTNAWNDPKLSPQIAAKFPGSFFVDLYDPQATTGTVDRFNSLFTASFGRAPRVLEAYGYDIMMMIREIASDRGSDNIRNAILEGRGYNGVTGIKGFSAGQGPIIESRVMMIK